MKKEVTIVIIDTLNPILARKAIELTAAAIPYDTTALTFGDKPIIAGETRIPILPLSGIDDYNELCLRGLWPYIETDHFVIVQYDGFATNAHVWSDDFLTVDYIGAPWPWIEENHRVGNGGFSLRSKKLLTALRDPNINVEAGNEDVVICRTNRRYLEEKYNIKFATTDLASTFSYEHGPHKESFGMHGIWNVPLYCTEEDATLILTTVASSSWSPERRIWVIQNCMLRRYEDLALRLVQMFNKEQL